MFCFSLSWKCESSAHKRGNSWRNGLEIISKEVVFKSVEVDKSIYPGFDQWTFPVRQPNWPKVALVWAECMSLPYYSWFLKGLSSSRESQVYFATAARGWHFLQAVCAGQAASDRWSSSNSELLQNEALDFDKNRERQELIQKFAFHPSQTSSSELNF